VKVAVRFDFHGDNAASESEPAPAFALERSDVVEAFVPNARTRLVGAGQKRRYNRAIAGMIFFHYRPPKSLLKDLKKRPGRVDGF
jgi:hypothetical protein